MPTFLEKYGNKKPTAPTGTSPLGPSSTPAPGVSMGTLPTPRNSKGVTPEGPEGKTEVGYTPPPPRTSPVVAAPAAPAPAAAAPAPAAPPGGGSPADLLTKWGISVPEGDSPVGMFERNGQPVVVTAMGNVYTAPDAPERTFLGSYNSQAMAGARNDPNRRFTGGHATDTGYQLTAAGGEGYDFYNDGAQLKETPAPLGTGSPEYEALVRALDLETSTAEGNAAMQKGELQRRTAFYEPEMQRQGGIARRGIASAAEGRGMWGGGSMARSTSEQRAAEATQIGQLRMGEAEGIGGVERELATRRTDVARRKAEAALTASGQKYLQDGLAPYQTPAVG